MCRPPYPRISGAQGAGDWEGSDCDGVSSYEGTAQIADIQSDSYLLQVEFMAQMGERINDSNLSFLTDSFDEHYQRIIRLEKWAKDNHLLVNPWESRK